VADHLYSWNNYNTFNYEAYFEDPSPTLKAKPCDGDDCDDDGFDDVPGTGDSGQVMMTNLPSALLAKTDQINDRKVVFYNKMHAHMHKTTDYKLEPAYLSSLHAQGGQGLGSAAKFAHGLYHQALGGKGPQVTAGQIIKRGPKPEIDSNGNLISTPAERRKRQKKIDCVQEKGVTNRYPFHIAAFEHGKSATKEILADLKTSIHPETAWRLYLMEGDNACKISDDATKIATTPRGWMSRHDDWAEEYWGNPTFRTNPRYEKLKDFLIRLKGLSKKDAEKRLENDEKELGASSESQAKLKEQQELKDKKIGFQAEPSKARFMEQCYLTHFMDVFARQSQWSSVLPMRFQHVRVIDGKTGTLISELNKRSGFNVMSKMTPAQMALLQPKIQLFKIRYNGQKISESKFVFDTETTRQDIRTIFETGAGRGGGIGIKDVSYEFLGGDPESAQRVITVKLTLFVQDIDKFFKEVPTKGIASPLDLVVPSRGKESIFKNSEDDWEIDPISGVAYHKSNVVDHETFEIKAVLGWSPPVRGNDLMSPALRRAVEHNQLVTILTLHDHSFEFNQDGSMTIAASYNGRIEGLLDDDPATNIFAQTEEEKKETKALQAQRSTAQVRVTDKNKKLEASRVDFLKKWMIANGDHHPTSAGIEFVRKAFDDGATRVFPHSSHKLLISGPLGHTPLLKKDITDWNLLKGGIKRGRKQILQKEKDDIAIIEEKIMMVRHQQHIALWKYLEANQMVHSVSLDKKSMDDYLRENGGSMNSFDQNAAAAPGSTSIPTPTIISGATAATAAVATAQAAAKAATTARRNPGGPQSANTSRVQISGPNYEFSYIYFGDLIDAALASISKRGFRSNGKRFRIALGPMTFGQGNRKLTLNLADVPISLNLFMDFYTENVVKQGKVRWPIMRFIKKVATDLIFSALGGECYENPVTVAARSPTRLALDLISFPKDIMAKTPRTDIAKLDLEKVNGNWSSSIKASSIYEYIVLHASFFTLSSREGKKSEDAKAGIYHLELGRDEGIVKEIQLSKENKPMLVSDRLARDGKINRIAHPYHADIKMVGNTFFRPGSRVFINPSMTSIGSATHRNSLVSKLGIGGYYIVLSVTGHLEAGRYETTLRAKWESNGFKTDKPSAHKFVESRIPFGAFGAFNPPKSATSSGLVPEALARPAGQLDDQLEIKKSNTTPGPQDPQARTERDTSKFQKYSNVLSRYEEFEQLPEESLEGLKERKRKYLQDQHGVYSITPKGEGRIEVEFIDAVGEGQGKVIYTDAGE
jgi:hypothetical protein